MLKYTIVSRDINGIQIMDEAITTFDLSDFVKPGDILKKNFLYSQRVVKSIELNNKSKLM